MTSDSRSSAGASLGDRTTAALAIVDSRAAADALFAASGGGYRIVSDNPLLANAPCYSDLIGDISGLVSQDEATRLGEASVDLLLGLDDRLLETGMAERFAGVSRRIHVTMPMRSTLATFLQRGLVASRAHEAAGRGQVVLGVTDEPRWSPVNPFQLAFFGSPHRALAEHGFFGDARVETVVIPAEVPEDFNDTRIDSLALRVAVSPLPHLFFHLTRRLKLSGLAPGRRLFYGKRCELLDETLPWLLLKGFGLHQSMPPGYAPAGRAGFDDEPVRDRDLEKAVLGWLEEGLAKLNLFTPRQVRAIAQATLGHLAAGLSVLPETRRRAEAWAEGLARAGARGFLTSGIYGPHGVIVHDVLRSRGIPLADFEHGVTAGIARTTDRRLKSGEATTSDILLTCSERSKGRFASAEGLTARRIEAVGNADQARRLKWPRLQRALARRRLRLAPGELAVMHVSTLLYGGTARAADDSPWEQEVFSIDRTLIEKVYGRVSATVLFKPYPVQRFADEERYQALFAVPPNMRMIGFEDFRYVRAAADVIVTQANSSTIGWCIAGDAPLVHLHSRRMNALADEDLLGQFREAFFCVDMDKAGWAEALAEVLSMDPAGRATAWREKAPARARLHQAALAGPASSPGRSAARIIAEQVRAT